MPCPTECSERLYSIILECWKDMPNDRPNFQAVKTPILDYLKEVSELYPKHTTKAKCGDDSDYEDSSLIVAQIDTKTSVYDATSDHDAKEENELSFKKGDLLSIKVNNNEEWSWGTSIKTGREGCIPNSSLPKQS